MTPRLIIKSSSVNRSTCHISGIRCEAGDRAQLRAAMEDKEKQFSRGRLSRGKGLRRTTGWCVSHGALGASIRILKFDAQLVQPVAAVISNVTSTSLLVVTASRVNMAAHMRHDNSAAMNGPKTRAVQSLPNLRRHLLRNQLTDLLATTLSSLQVNFLIVNRLQ